jgi:hypothetical protein
MSFQAPEFYESQRYELFGVLEGFAGEHQRMYYRKRLREDARGARPIWASDALERSGLEREHGDVSMEEQMDKEKIVQQIQSEREALEKTLARLTDDQMAQRGVEADWSVKDILAHITDWERRMVRWIEESLRGEVPERPAPGLTWDDLDRLNEETFLLHRDEPLDAILSEFYTSYQQALATVEGLREEDLVAPDRFAWREGDPMWHMVAANTFWHYKEHNETIENWLKTKADEV